MRTARYLLPALIPALVLILGGTGAAIAQDVEDPPDRVGRLSFLRGDVSFRPGGVEEWADATLNYPLTTGDDLWADAGARAEIALGSAAVRLAPSTAFGFLALEDQLTQIRLTQGALQIRIRDLGEDETFEIDTPNGAVTLWRPGTYRVDVDPNGDATTLTVRDGEAELTASGSSFSVDAGDAATVRGTDSPDYDVHDAIPADEWERWGTTRDRRRDLSISARYVSRDMPGYEDLDDNGVWSQVPEYGAVWTPRRVVAGWAPYRNGHWAWVDPWGWTWIDDAPWGFAPYHYGRWAYIGRGWAWVPGRVVVRPVYAPALVAFVGGSNFSISVGVGGGVGWFPLGPNEPYVPTYRVSDRYVRNVNITNVNVTNITIGNMTTFKYRNRGLPGGVTVVTRETFVGARPVGRSLIVVPRDRLNSAPVVGTSAPFAPTRESVARLGGRPVRRPPVNANTRRVVVRTTPPPPPVPFAVRERALQGRPGRPLDRGAVNALRGRAPVTENRVRPATEGGGRALRPAREGLPEVRAATPSTGGRRSRPDRGQPGDRSRPPSGDDRGRRPEGARPQPEPRPPVEPQRPPERPGVPMPTPPLLPPENPEPARTPRPDRGRRPERPQDDRRPQGDPRAPAPTPTPEPPRAPEPPAQQPREERGRRPDERRPQAEAPPPTPQPTPEPPRAPEPPAQPPREDRGRRPDERRRPQPEAPPQEPQPTPEPPRAAEPAEQPPGRDRGRREQPAPNPPPQAAPTEPAPG